MILGLDTRSRATHAVASEPLDDGGSCYWWVVSTAEIQEMAWVDLFYACRDMFKWLPSGSHVFCEEPLALRQNPATTRVLCMTAGVVYAAFVASDVYATWYSVNPATWKKAVLGRGVPPQGQKHKPWIAGTLDQDEAFAAWVERQGWERTTGDLDAEPDLRDAWCLMRYGQSVLESL